MTKDQIIEAIRHAASSNGGVPLGSARFEAATGIKHADWFGVYWARWGDAVREAGFEPNQMQGAYESPELLQKYAELARELGRLPVKGDLRIKRRSDKQFPSDKVFERFGKKAEFVRQLADFCRSNDGFESVAGWCDKYASIPVADGPSPLKEVAVGYVYLLRHGTRREYKIGRTNNQLRREGEIGIELPEKIVPIHIIETDDPSGVEAYWHRRFDAKRMKNEWFALSSDDVRAFKRWRRING
ncbi:MAG: GIY-YIG nuclease family protein [Planctomycetota bacterium]|nr:GIY-YIG nuclease family protein [Planctomycetota bacterium]